MPRILFIGSFFNGPGDIVDEILMALREIYGADAVTHHDPQLYRQRPFKTITRIRLADVATYLAPQPPQAIVFAAGGLCPEACLRDWARANGVKQISLQLSDPDDFAKRGREIGPQVDVVATNAVDCLSGYNELTRAIHMPFGCSIKHFKESAPAMPRYDVCIIGEARPERVRLAKDLARNGISLDIHGRYWTRWRNPLAMRSLPIPFWKPRYVSGQAKYERVVQSFLYLSFCRTLAGYTNIKVGFYEALAVGAIIAVDADAATLERELRGHSLNIYRFESAREIIAALRELKALSLEQLTEKRQANQHAFEAHFAWKKRLEALLSEI